MDNKLLDKVNSEWLPFFNDNKKELEDIMFKIDFNKIVFPYKEDIFRALFYNSPSNIKLLILGQDPYINSEIIDGIKVPQACGLSFSVPPSHKKIPPSLKNIFKEIKNNYPEYIIPNNGDLSRWVTEENIMLLNSALTVVEGKSNSHAKIWINFTDKLIKYISLKNEGMIFLLMGNYAINKIKLIDSKHKIFECVHPSPLSANRGFFGCNVFKKINEYLVENNKDPIKW
jgi:uracil-DNA glycosylase